MWSEWLTRTLRPRPGEAAAIKRAPAPDEQNGRDEVRPSTRELALAAQDEEERSLVSADTPDPFTSS
jgi:hypothetical protein